MNIYNIDEELSHEIDKARNHTNKSNLSEKEKMDAIAFYSYIKSSGKDWEYLSKVAIHVSNMDCIWELKEDRLIARKMLLFPIIMNQ